MTFLANRDTVQFAYCFKQVTGTAGEYQVEGATNFATLDIRGSATTTVSLIVGR